MIKVSMVYQIPLTHSKKPIEDPSVPLTENKILSQLLSASPELGDFPPLTDGVTQDCAMSGRD